MADWVGKKKTLWAACVISVVAVFIQIFALQAGVLMAGKVRRNRILKRRG